MELGQAIFGRRAIREYLKQPVDEQLMRHLIEDAVQAPSAVNEQLWTFTVVRDQTVLDRISERAKAHMLAPATADHRNAHFQSHLADPHFHIFYHAPVLVLISAARESRWSIEDCTLAAENMMLSAYASGLGTCWIGFAQSFLNTAEGKAMLGLSPACVPVAPIIVGYPKRVPEPVARKAPEMHWVG